MRKVEQPERQLQSKQRLHFSEEKQSDRSTAKLQGQQKSLSNLLTQGATKILQLLQNGSFFFNRLSLHLCLKITVFYCFKT